VNCVIIMNILGDLCDRMFALHDLKRLAFGEFDRQVRYSDMGVYFVNCVITTNIASDL